MPEYGSRSRHENRTQAGAGCLDDGMQLVPALLLQVIGKLDNQDSILRDQTDERNQSHLAVDVKRRQAEERKRERPGDGQRHRTGENDKRIAETLKLRCQYQVNQNSREQERAQKFAALDAKLPGLTGIVNGEALGQDLTGLILEERQRLVERHGRRNYALNPHRIELLKFIQRPGLGRSLQAGKSGQ